MVEPPRDWSSPRFFRVATGDPGAAPASGLAGSGNCMSPSFLTTQHSVLHREHIIQVVGVVTATIVVSTPVSLHRFVEHNITSDGDTTCEWITRPVRLAAALITINTIFLPCLPTSSDWALGSNINNPTECFQVMNKWFSAMSYLLPPSTALHGTRLDVHGSKNCFSLKSRVSL
jgi:hypothetical protein